MLRIMPLRGWLALATLVVAEAACLVLIFHF